MEEEFITDSREETKIPRDIYDKVSMCLLKKLSNMDEIIDDDVVMYILYGALKEACKENGLESEIAPDAFFNIWRD